MSVFVLAVAARKLHNLKHNKDLYLFTIFVA